MKKWYKSKSIWSANLKALSGVALLLSQVLAGDLSGMEAAVSILSITWGAVDHIIRWKTKEAITK